MHDSGEFDGLVERVAAEMAGVSREHADRRGALLFECSDAIQTLTTRLAESEARASAVWRNGVTNTAALIDIARKRRPVSTRNKAYAAFDAELNDLIEKWFSFSRGVTAKDWEEVEANWKRFLSLTNPENTHG